MVMRWKERAQRRLEDTFEKKGNSDDGGVKKIIWCVKKKENPRNN